MTDSGLRKAPRAQRDDTPFTGDLLNRKVFADRMTDLIATAPGPFVISVKGEYGTGKSYFAGEWKKKIEAEGGKVVLFDAWKSDFMSDPMAALVMCLDENLKGNSEDSDTILDNIKKRVASPLIKNAPYLIGKAILSKAFGDGVAEDASNIFKMGKGDISDLISGYSESLIIEQKEIYSNMEKFKEDLSLLVREISGFDDEGGLKNKLIFIVDELDRCRPDYAIKVLEKIKHFFDVEGVIFVLMVAERQIHSAIHAVYGSEVDSAGYLKRFIDWEVSLPTPNPEAIVNELYDHYGFEHLFSQRGNSGQPFDNFIPNLFRVMGVPIRNQKKIFLSVKVIIENCQSLRGFPCIPIFVLVTLKDHSPSLYKEVLNLSGPEAYEKIRRHFQIWDAYDRFNRDNMSWLEGSILGTFLGNGDTEWYDKQNEYIESSDHVDNPPRKDRLWITAAGQVSGLSYGEREAREESIAAVERFSDILCSGN
ncbi:KAP family P-loop NTPase fold protein [Yunchengibacter salinarum]|uniref:KAP family P-loop NTPase fold protein n=1 Tax=Yunchengibacter salinarum TaxID=3133399 RepID=UPI0035B5B66F